MTLLRNIFSDLVEKRLWPLAVVLIAALFVAPSMLSKPAATVTDTADVVRAAPGSAAARAAAAPAAQVALDTTVPNALRTHGAMDHNPFAQQYVTKAVAAGSTATGSAGSAGSAGSPGSSTPTIPVGTPKTTTKVKHGTKKKATTTKVSVTLRFGEAGNLSTLPNIVAYTPLPSQSEPFFVFLGVKADDPNVAVFLISSDAKATGDGVCKPDATSCETIEMKAGDTEFFDLATDSGTKQYQLDISKVVN